MTDEPVPGCTCGALPTKLQALGDPEGARLPDGLPPVWDAHVHVFPDRLFNAVWAWFEEHGWPIRYKLYARETVRFQLDRGVERVVALHYAHKAGMARALNTFVAELAAEEPAVVPMATVFPGEPGARAILADAFAAGHRGVKLHCHECFAPDESRMVEVYEACAAAGRPLVMHAGREPKSPAYKCDPHALCSVDRVERVLRDHPKLKLVVPHLGFDETAAYLHLLERFDNLWLDTTMAVAGYFPHPVPWDLVDARPDRILYGTDFPNLPYAWDRELLRLAARAVPPADLERVLGGNAKSLFA